MLESLEGAGKGKMLQLNYNLKNKQQKKLRLAILKMNKVDFKDKGIIIIRRTIA